MQRTLTGNKPDGQTSCHKSAVDENLSVDCYVDYARHVCMVYIDAKQDGRRKKVRSAVPICRETTQEVALIKTRPISFIHFIKSFAFF